MKKIITRDGSETFFSEECQESYHSISGAAEEAVKKYAEPCRIASFRQVRLLDVCFGLGYNSAAALDAFHGERIEIVGLENDEKILNQARLVHPPFQSYNAIQQAAQNKFSVDGTRSVTLIMGDARDSVKELKQLFHSEHDLFDVVFFGPFSPKKCPELWTLEFLTDIHAIMKKGGTLATYSCAAAVRQNLQKAGFSVHDGPIVGRKSPGTIAIAQCPVLNLPLSPCELKR
ncbi:hypothetical protein HY772_02240 [Candidatus Woesearchaeota archaeon]|nr:hypothetical protein [Candidatus Woesearchaeota archaeon]